MKEIEAGIVRETAKFVESLASMITTAIVTKLMSNKTTDKSVIIYR